MLLLVSLVLSFALVGVLIPALRRARFIDVPNHRSSHFAPIPRGGGLAVMMTIPLGLWLGNDFAAWPLVGVALLLAVVGLADDIRPLPGGARLLAQVVAALAICTWSSLSFGATDWLRLAVAAVVIVGFVNAFNFMDGVNGISGLVTAVIGAFWAIIGVRQDLDWVSALGLVLAGAALGFLPWNAPRARVFLGDVGSYGLGLLVGSLSALAWMQGVHWLLALAPLVVYGADTGWVLAKRARGGRPLMEAHREHVYQRMVDGGWSHLRAAGLCAMAVALTCLAATLTWERSPLLGLLVVVVLATAYLLTPGLMLRKREVTA